MITTDTAVAAGTSWIYEHASSEQLTPKTLAVMQVLASQPRLSSYSSADKVAQAAGVNVATVIRTAQSLGFAGWPVLRAEIRARYLASLSVPEIAAEHADEEGSGAFASSMQRDLESLAHSSRHVHSSDVQAFVQAIVTSKQTLVVAQGSFESVGQAFVHNATIAGYRLELSGGTSSRDMLNTLSSLGSGDTLIAISLWRQYERTVRAAQVAREQGATVCVITDSIAGSLAEYADHRIIVSAEGASFFPSVIGAMSVVQGICAELAATDPEHTRASIERSEALWERFGVLHVPRGK